MSVALVTCSPTNQTNTADLIARRRVENARYAFIIGEGSGWQGFDTVKIAADGAAAYTFGAVIQRGGERTYVHYRLEFRLAPDVLAALWREIDEVGFFTLHPTYENPDESDGTQWFVRVRRGGERHGVYCDNAFPPEIRRLSLFVHQQILAPLPPALLRQARELQPGDAFELERY